MNYLVTGAAGFIASKVCEKLLNAGNSVVGVDNLNPYYDVRLKDYRIGLLAGDDGWRANQSCSHSKYDGLNLNPGNGFNFRKLDIENLSALDALFREFQFDAVFNLAARAGVRHSLEDPHVYLKTNTHGTLNLLECQRKHRVRKLVLASTSSLYAGGPMPFSEDQPVNTPLSPYAASKKAAELMAYSYHNLFGLDITIVRYFTVFGPAGRPDMSIFRFIRWIDEGTPLELFGDGNQSRDFTYVDDIAEGTILAGKPLGYEIINLGGGRNPISLLKMISLIESELDKKAVIRGLPSQAADIRESWADIEKAGRLLNWRPKVGLEDGIRRCVAWYRSNQDWLSNIKL